MRLAFVIFKYFPYGGVQRDMLRIAQDCVALGHDVTIFTGEWQGPEPSDMKVVLVANQPHTFTLFNHQKHDHLIKKIQAHIAQETFDLVIGFNRMSGLDVYFAADSCFVDRAHEERPWWYQYTPRYRWFAQAENAIFNVAQHTHILTLTQAEQTNFQHWYATPDARFHLIPPFLSAKRFTQALQLSFAERELIRQQVRVRFGFSAEDKLLLLVGSGFKTKGADRMVEAIHALPSTLREQVKALIIGQDASKQLEQQIAALGLQAQIQVLPGRDDIPLLMQASDVLVHPARRELAGHVLLEAMACGLPVLTTDKCGYATHIAQAKAGVVLASPFLQETLNQTLEQMLNEDSQPYQTAGQAYAQKLMLANAGQAEATIITQIAPLIQQTKASNAKQTTLNADNGIWLAPSHQTHLQHMTFEEFMALGGYTVRATANRKTMRVDIRGRSYFVKQHEGVGWWELIKNVLSFKRPIIGAMTEVKAIQKLNQIGIATTPIAAYGIQGNLLATQRSFLLTDDLGDKALGDIVSLEDIVKTWAQHPPREGERAVMLTAVAKLAKRFHAAGLCHRDFYLCHIALQRHQVVTTDTNFYLLDLHRVLHGQSPHGYSVCKDIAGLIFSCMDYGFSPQDWDCFKAYYLPQSEQFWQRAFARAQRLHAKFHSKKQQARFKAQKAATDLE